MHNYTRVAGLLLKFAFFLWFASLAWKEIGAWAWHNPMQKTFAAIANSDSSETSDLLLGIMVYGDFGLAFTRALYFGFRSTFGPNEKIFVSRAKWLLGLVPALLIMAIYPLAWYHFSSNPSGTP